MRTTLKRGMGRAATLNGNGRAVFVVEPSTTDAQIDALARIYTGQLGGLPWSILGTTYSVAGLVKAPIEIVDNGRHSSVRIPGIAHGHLPPAGCRVTAWR